MRLLHIKPLTSHQKSSFPAYSSFGVIREDLARRLSAAEESLSTADNNNRILAYYNPYASMIAARPHWLAGVLRDVLDLPLRVTWQTITTEYYSSFIGGGVLGRSERVIGPEIKKSRRYNIQISDVSPDDLLNYLPGGASYNFIREKFLPMFGLKASQISIAVQIKSDPKSPLFLGVGQHLSENLIIQKTFLP